MSAEISRDRRELWHLENFLAVSATNATQRERCRTLREYLHSTCTHEWSNVGGWGGSPKGTLQCSWCSTVVLPRDPEWADAYGEASA